MMKGLKITNVELNVPKLRFNFVQNPYKFQ